LRRSPALEPAQGFMTHFQGCEVAQKAREELQIYALGSGGDDCMLDAQFVELLRSNPFLRKLSFLQGL
jgi:hypothetical protein